MIKATTILILAVVVICALADAADCSVILKTIAVNPSKFEAQKAQLKAYLPKEVKPEDILDRGELEIGYDDAQGLYYVYKEIELAPGESVTRRIEIRDVWLIEEAELEQFVERAKTLAKALKQTKHFDLAIGLQKDIEAKSSAILNKQNQALDVLPQTHIAVYRDNLKVMDESKLILSRLEKMVVEHQALMVQPKKEEISVQLKLAVALAALGLICLILFAVKKIGHRQA